MLRFLAIASTLAGPGLSQERASPAITADAPENPASANSEKSSPPILLEKDVLPILQGKCVRCHGSKVRKADLDLSTAAGVLSGGSSGNIVVPKMPDESLLFEMLHEGKMPPKDEKERPTAGEIETIRRWIADGAQHRDGDLADRAGQRGGYQEVMSILRLRCTACHGRQKQESELQLTNLAAMLKGGKSGPAINPRDAAASKLVEKVRSGSMPPRDKMLYAGVSPMTDGELALIARWIDRGAAEEPLVEDIPTTVDDRLVTDDDRQYWAFQPPRQAPIPQVGHAALVKNPIDSFLLARLEERGLSLSPEADKTTLIRRAAFDLTGLPPSPEDVRLFPVDEEEGAYERLIERLLASPRYGERWGQYWLDAAGYSDSESKLVFDWLRPNAFRYRDYVIRALNSDKPYDRFLTEQLAGDDLVEYEKPAEVTQELIDTLAATGFLRMAPDPTDHELYDNVPGRLEVIADEIDVLSSTILGLTLKCARCHDHKFDPLPQRDYFRLLSVFRGAWDEHDWVKPAQGRVLALALDAEKKIWQEHNDPLTKQIQDLNAQVEKLAEKFRQPHVEKRLAEIPEALRDDLRKMLATAADKRDAIQKYLAEKFEISLRIDNATLKLLEPEFKDLAAPLEKRSGWLADKQWVGQPAVHALVDRGEPTPTQIYRRGDHMNRAGYVGPGFPSVLTNGKTPFAAAPPREGSKSTGRRLAFARWLTRPDHPLTSRVMANRIWRHHFGRGIVTTLDNFGRTGARPTHPELLDWLAVEFVKSGWSVKHLHRLMMTSAAYRQSSRIRPNVEIHDPDNAYLSRMPLRRMEAEVLRDCVLAVAGRLDEAPFGPADPVEVQDDGLVTAVDSDRGWRRSIYLRHRRTTIPTILETFDLPQMSPNCTERRDSCMAPQALHLLNDDWVRLLAGEFARRVLTGAGAEPAAQVEQVYWLALSRPPSDSERAGGVEALNALAEAWREGPAGTAQDAAQRSAAASLNALATFVHTVLNSAAFVYID